MLERVSEDIDETTLSEVMLTVSDPAEAVSYFTNASASEPERVDLLRGLEDRILFERF